MEKNISMTPEQKNLLLKELCARLPYHVIVEYKGANVDLTQYARSVKLESCKPYLRPMSSMTEDEKLDYIALGDIKRYTNPQYAYLISEQLDYLNAHHFDYRGLIEKGLALEAPKDMYKTE